MCIPLPPLFLTFSPLLAQFHLLSFMPELTNTGCNNEQHFITAQYLM